MSVNQDKIKAIIQKIWSKLPNPQPMSGNDIPDKIDEVYEAGKEQRLSDMWDMIQANGNRTIYTRAFSNMYISKDLFKPKYDFKFSNSQYLFTDAYGDVLDLDAIEKECGIVFDFSEATVINAAFQYAPVEKANVIDGSNSKSLNYFFCGTNSFNPHPIKWVNKLIVNPEATFTSSFNWCTLLEHIIFEGTIGKSGLTLSHSTKLDKESLISVVNTLSATTTGLSVTLSKTAVNKAFETSEGANDGSTSTEWATLIATKSNWTISLA